MQLKNSPSFDTIDQSLSEGVNNNQPPSEKKVEKRVWILLGIFVVLCVAFITVQLIQAGGVADFGTGTVTGYAVNEAGEAIQVEVLVYNTAIIINSDINGYFIVNDVPVGDQSIIVAYENIASEIIAQVERDRNVSFDTVTVPTEFASLVDGL